MKSLQVAFGLVLVAGFSSAFASLPEDNEAIKACLSHWGKAAPFAKDTTDYRTISAKVKVLGVGSDVNDNTPTQAPELVLVKPSVAVMAKTKIKLMNPNGWYCLKNTVAVMGATAMEVHCKAHIASFSDGVAVAGSSEGEGSGTAVLGSSNVKRVGCETN